MRYKDGRTVVFPTLFPGVGRCLTHIGREGRSRVVPSLARQSMQGSSNRWRVRSLVSPAASRAMAVLHRSWIAVTRQSLVERWRGTRYRVRLQPPLSNRACPFRAHGLPMISRRQACAAPG
jgi:hypothetical protein